MVKILSFASMVLLLAGCSNSDDKQNRFVGDWRIVYDLGDDVLPFQSSIMLSEDDDPVFYAINGDERIRAETLVIKGDSIRVQLPIFNTELIGCLKGDAIVGNFNDYSRKGIYAIPFKAFKGEMHRFDVAVSPKVDISGKWEVAFSPGSDHEYQAIGEFRQEGDKAFGTFLTTTGDYRYLEGNVDGDKLLLSCFDGSHVFLFKAVVNGDTIRGDFWSGTHWQENWEGFRNQQYNLPNPDSLTFLKPGFEKIEFSFPSIDGGEVSLADPQFRNKVVIVQLMGSWCPNCMDETAYLVSLYNKFQPEGLEVVSLAFEKSDKLQTNKRSLERLRGHFGIPYPLLMAGRASKKEAAQKLPMLNHVLSFPTTIFIDRNGNVRRIHTGFSGPGTGEYYQEFVDETDDFVLRLLLE